MPTAFAIKILLEENLKRTGHPKGPPLSGNRGGSLKPRRSNVAPGKYGARIANLRASSSVKGEHPKIMDDIMESIENLPSSVYYGGVLGSILLSIVLFVSGKKLEGIFVGLWAPTIFNFGLYNKLLKPSREAGTPDIP